MISSRFEHVLHRAHLLVAPRSTAAAKGIALVALLLLLLLFVAFEMSSSSSSSSSSRRSASSLLADQAASPSSAQQNRQISSLSASSSSSSSDSAIEDFVPPLYSQWLDLGPPLTRQTLGAASWALLHTMAARFPLEATAREAEEMSSFLHLFATFYPCPICSTHFQQLLIESPPNTSGRLALTRWLCERHNDVNLRLHKPVFECERVMSVWTPQLRQCGCDEAPTLETNASNARL